MLISEYISAGGLLFNDNYEIFNTDTLTARIKYTFGSRTIREDVPQSDLPNVGQMCIDVNKDLLKQLFEYSAQFNPKAVISRVISRETTDNDTNTRTNELTDTAKNTGTVTIAGEGTDTPNLTTATTKSAYNATAAKPAESVTQTGTNQTTTNGTTINDLTTVTTRGGTVADVAEKHGIETVKETGVGGADEIRAAFEKYILPYDYLARLLTNDLCYLIW